MGATSWSASRRAGARERARGAASAIAVRGELIDPRGLAARAAESRRASARRTYAAVYTVDTAVNEQRLEDAIAGRRRNPLGLQQLAGD